MDDFLPNHNGIQRLGDWGGVAQFGGGDPSMVVMFYQRPVRNPAKSAETGRPMFDNKIYVKIHPPGERLNIVDKEATQNEQRRFPMQWAQFQTNRPQVSDGTPIDMLFAANPAVAEMLKASGVHTVEQCAKLSAHAIESIGMGAQQWVNDAVRYMEVADKGVKASQLKKALDDKDMEINTLKHKIDLMQAEMTLLRENQTNAVTMADVQRLLAGNGGNGNRGVFAPGTLNANFDAQAAQINATHATHDLAKAKPVKRPRVRINN
jgi:hypothetical protein